ncbi:hypothetical protein Bca4012_030610 [Brassica carinata]
MTPTTIKSQEIVNACDPGKMSTASSTCSSPNPDDLLLNALKPSASPSLTLPSAIVGFNTPLTNEEIIIYNDLPPRSKSISNYAFP